MPPSKETICAALLSALESWTRPSLSGATLVPCTGNDSAVVSPRTTRWPCPKATETGCEDALMICVASIVFPRRTKIVTLEEPKLTAAASLPSTATPPALPLAPPAPPVGTKSVSFVRVLITARKLAGALVMVKKSGSWPRLCLAWSRDSPAAKQVDAASVTISGSAAHSPPGRFLLLNIISPSGSIRICELHMPIRSGGERSYGGYLRQQFPLSSCARNSSRKDSPWRMCTYAQTAEIGIFRPEWTVDEVHVLDRLRADFVDAKPAPGDSIATSPSDLRTAAG